MNEMCDYGENESREILHGDEGNTVRTEQRGEPRPPPPGGLLWNAVGEVRNVLTLPAALLLQVARPSVGAGVDEHSVFRADPWGRLERSLNSLQLWVYGGTAAAAEGRRLRQLHRSIRGTDASGSPYHALSPAHYGWVHATGFPVLLNGAPYLSGRALTGAEERRLYAEWLQVGRVLGLRDRDMPQTVEDFWAYWRRMLGEIERTLVVEELIDPGMRVSPPDRGPRAVRAALRLSWPALGPALGRLHRFFAVGFLPPDAREVLGLDWSPRQERRLAAACRLVRTVVPLLPERLRYLPYAYRARKAHRAPRAH
jgi:uncharacterized protein (DUF2236 family)